MRLLKISGDSMSPTLQDGDYILAVNTKPRSLRPGFIYVIDHPDLGRIIKRLQKIDGDQCVIVGDHSHSTPQSILGPVPKSRLSARAILAFTKTGIKRL